MKKISFAALALGLLLSAALKTTALAEDMIWQFQNETGADVQIQLYSQDRSNIWPSEDRVYAFGDGDERSARIECRDLEKICFGAWVEGDPSRYWGVGVDDERGCDGCCRDCDGALHLFGLE